MALSGNGPFHMHIGLGCLQANTVLAVGLQAADPAQNIIFASSGPSSSIAHYARSDILP
jgi:hypothetical protein